MDKTCLLKSCVTSCWPFSSALTAFPIFGREIQGNFIFKRPTKRSPEALEMHDGLRLGFKGPLNGSSVRDDVCFSLLHRRFACLCSDGAQPASACSRNTRVSASASALAHVQRKNAGISRTRCAGLLLKVQLRRCVRRRRQIKLSHSQWN